MQEIQDLEQRLLQRRKELGLNLDGTRPGGPHRLVALALDQATATTTSHSETHLSYVCPTCGQEVGPLKIEVLGQVRYVRGNCQTCKPAWVLDREAIAAAQADLQRQKRLMKYRGAFPQDEMGKRLLAASLDNFQLRLGSQMAFQHAKQLAASFPKVDSPSLLIWGEPGNGKSHLAAGIAHQAVSAGLAVAWVHGPTWLRRLGTLEPSEREELLSLAARADLLVFDDLAGGKLTGPRVDWLLYLIDERYRHERLLVATTNLAPNDLVQALNQASVGGDSDAEGLDGARIVDRLSEMCVIVRNQAGSYRQELARDRRAGMLGA